MVYPQAPWTLQGKALVNLHLLDIDRVRSLVPRELEIVSIWPGKTLGGIYLSSYESGSVLQYNELIVVAAVASYAGQIGSWVSHIYVDNPDSVAGAREIWGLPKELAEFTWSKGNQSSVTVNQGDRQLCHFSYTQPTIALPLPIPGQSFSSLGNDFVLFKSEFKSNFGLVSAKLEIPTESPFANLNLGQPWLSVYCEDMRLVVHSPEVVGQKSAEFSYS